jgi:hypothetical protein
VLNFILEGVYMEIESIGSIPNITSVQAESSASYSESTSESSQSPSGYEYIGQQVDILA